MVWQGDAALAVAWDRVVVDRLLSSAGGSRSIALWPETFLREPPSQDGLRVLQCLEGVEAQLWHRASLQASRWWPQRPDALDAQTWLHSLGTNAGAGSALPALSPAAWRRRPWANLQSLDGLSSTTSRLERVAVATYQAVPQMDDALRSFLGVFDTRPAVPQPVARERPAAKR